MRSPRVDEGGSILPLVIGYAVLAIALIVVCVDATALHLAQKRLDALAASAALAAADGFALSVEGGAVRARLDDARVAEQAAAFLAATGDGAALVSAEAPDGVSARVTVATAWHAPIVSAFVPGGIPLHATATSRTGLE
ncbi:pilus assembly protein TadG-related protein [Microbacterium sp. NPDC055683]